MDRMIYESIRIAQRPSEMSLNSKMENAGSGIIKPRFESDLTQKKNERMIINEAFKAREDTIKKMSTEATNDTKISNVKNKVMEIEKKLQQENKNVNKITKFFRGKNESGDIWRGTKQR